MLPLVIRKKEDPKNDVTLENVNIDEYDRVVIVDVEIVDVDDQSIDSTFGDKCEQTSNDNLEDVNDKVDAEPANVDVGKVFACQMCDYKAGKKFDMTTHLEDFHSWCYICFSTFNNKEDLKKHIQNHSKK